MSNYNQKINIIVNIHINQLPQDPIIEPSKETQTNTWSVLEILAKVSLIAKVVLTLFL